MSRKDRFGRARATLLTSLDPGSPSDSEKPIVGKKLGRDKQVKLYLLTGKIWFCDRQGVNNFLAEKDALSLPIIYMVYRQVDGHRTSIYPFDVYIDSEKTLRDFHTEIYRAFSRSCGDLFWVSFTIGSKQAMYSFEFHAEENPFGPS